ncbi:TPA: integrase [Klebsiella pneumoniae]|nr:integrase [Klebsiella pneumoniae]
MATTKIITQSEAFKLISWLESHNKQLFADVAIAMASLCLRVGDALSLKFSDFVEGDTLKITESKTGKQKEIVVPAKVWEIVQRRKATFPRDTYLFTSHSNRASGLKPVSREQVNRELKQAAENVGIKGTVGCHSFRKFAATQVFEQSNGNLALAMRTLNHSDPKVTMNYLKIDVKSVGAALANIWE